MPSEKRQLSSKEVFTCPWWKLKHDKYLLNEAGDKTGDYYYVETGGSVFIIPVLEDGRIILLKQYRYLVDREVIELPGGGIKEGQDPHQAALAELEEETGHTTDQLEHIGESIPFNGVSNEICHVFVAKNVRHIGQRLEESEDIKPIIVTAEELCQMIENNEIQDGMSLAALMLARKYLDI